MAETNFETESYSESHPPRGAVRPAAYPVLVRRWGPIFILSPPGISGARQQLPRAGKVSPSSLPWVTCACDFKMPNKHEPLAKISLGSDNEIVLHFTSVSFFLSIPLPGKMTSFMSHEPTNLWDPMKVSWYGDHFTDQSRPKQAWR